MYRRKESSSVIDVKNMATEKQLQHVSERFELQLQHVSEGFEMWPKPPYINLHNETKDKPTCSSCGGDYPASYNQCPKVYTPQNQTADPETKQPSKSTKIIAEATSLQNRWRKTS